MARDMRRAVSDSRQRRLDRKRATPQAARGGPVSWSPGNAPITPSRVNIQPARASRNQAVGLLMPAAASQFPAGMQCRDAARIVAPCDAFKSGLLDHRGKVLLVGELADRLHEVAIRLAVPRNKVADARNGIERPGFVDLVEHGHLDL